MLMAYPQEHCVESSSKNKAGRLQPLSNDVFRMTIGWKIAGAWISKWNIHLLKTVAVEHVWAIAAVACSGKKSTSRPGSSESDSKFFWAAVMCQQSLYKLLQVIVKKFYLILGQDLQLHFPKWVQNTIVRLGVWCIEELETEATENKYLRFCKS